MNNQASDFEITSATSEYLLGQLKYFEPFLAAQPPFNRAAIMATKKINDELERRKKSEQIVTTNSTDASPKATNPGSGYTVSPMRPQPATQADDALAAKSGLFAPAAKPPKPEIPLEIVAPATPAATPGHAPDTEKKTAAANTQAAPRVPHHVVATAPTLAETALTVNGKTMKPGLAISRLRQNLDGCRVVEANRRKRVSESRQFASAAAYWAALLAYYGDESATLAAIETVKGKTSPLTPEQRTLLEGAKRLRA